MVSKAFIIEKNPKKTPNNQRSSSKEKSEVYSPCRVDSNAKFAILMYKFLLWSLLGVSLMPVLTTLTYQQGNIT